MVLIIIHFAATEGIKPMHRVLATAGHMFSQLGQWKQSTASVAKFTRLMNSGITLNERRKSDDTIYSISTWTSYYSAQTQACSRRCMHIHRMFPPLTSIAGDL